MIRTLTGIGFALALAGAAQAQPQRLVVHTSGQSDLAARAALYQAAKTVCASPQAAIGWDSVCVDETYNEALRHLRSAPVVQQTASLQTVAIAQ